ncbi:hypothetical protein BaRGS_00019945 [Batillaria attramentaria]|uniref:Sulfatase N-terminal domain-containing protein n=1 Tax=Batillaria attramentaria TaxID=370345 RepID=A0ABD0KP42_9CAEN
MASAFTLQFICVCVLFTVVVTWAKPPHIIFIVADDLGWNDVGWHNPSMVTPTLSRLARQGVILDSAYVQPICTPSRASFLTGYFPIRLGLQFIPTNITVLPEALKTRGYQTHMVGKWHLGFCNWKYTPTGRGFDSFFGYLYGSSDYYLHSASADFRPEFKATTWLTSGPLSLLSSSVRVSSVLNKKAYDFRFNQSVYTEGLGKYATELFTERAVTIIERHDKRRPLFLYLAFKSPHGPLQVPQRYENLCRHVRSKSRKLYCGMVACLDEAVGNITRTLKQAGMMKNLLLIFTTDNGGAVYAGGNNLPLRGAKTTLWEGGTRGPAFVYSPTLLDKRGYTHTGLFHAVDWFPTILHVAGLPPVRGLDGVNQWNMISKGHFSGRFEFPYNIDDEESNGALRFGDWKLIVGRAGIFNRWYPVKGEHANRTDYDRDHSTHNSTYMLFNVKDDPEERNDRYQWEPGVASAMLGRLEEWRKVMVPPQNPTPHPRADPDLYGGTWSPGWC